MRRLAAALALLALLAPLAAAQERINPIQGAYGEVYVIAGRALDADGNPIVRGTVTASLDSPGVQATPLSIGTDCYGTFFGYYTLHAVNPKGSITVAIKGPDGEGSQSKGLDPFFRRSDFLLRYPGHTQGACPDAQPTPWGSRATVSGRLLERVPSYDPGTGSLDARPFQGYVRLALVLKDGSRFCPPSQQGATLCEPIPVDERGDFRYSWTFNDAFNATGHVEVVAGNRTFNETLDPVYRIAWADEETTGQGPPAPAPTPLPPVLALAAVAVAAFAARRLLPGHPR